MTITRYGRQVMVDWIHRHKPDGLGKLAQKTQIPTTSLQKVRQKRPLKDAQSRQRLARELGIEESELFADKRSAKSRAS